MMEMGGKQDVRGRSAGELAAAPRRVVLEGRGSVLSLLAWRGERAVVLAVEQEVPEWVQRVAALRSPQSVPGCSEGESHPASPARTLEASFATLAGVLAGLPDVRGGLPRTAWAGYRLVAVERAPVPVPPKIVDMVVGLELSLHALQWTLTLPSESWQIVGALEAQSSVSATHSLPPLLRALRRLRGWTQREAAQAVDCGSRTWHRIEKGRQERMKQAVLVRCRQEAAHTGCWSLEQSLTVWERRGSVYYGPERRGGRPSTRDEEYAQ